MILIVLRSTVRCFEDCRSVGIYLVLFSWLDGFVGFGRMNRAMKYHAHHSTYHHITSRVQTSNMNINVDANINRVLHASPLQSHTSSFFTCCSLWKEVTVHISPGSSGGTHHLPVGRACDSSMVGRLTSQDCVFLKIFLYIFICNYLLLMFSDTVDLIYWFHYLVNLAYLFQ